MQTIQKVNDVTHLIVTKNTNNSLSAYQIVECNKVKYRLHCSLDSSMAMGFNSDLCIKMFNIEKGMINIVDNKMLGFRSNFYNEDNKEDTLKECFEKFKEYIALLN